MGSIKTMRKSFNKQILSDIAIKTDINHQMLLQANERLDVSSTILLSLLATIDLPKLPSNSDKAIPFNENYFLLDGKIYKKG